jgi:hypothetical protein
MPALWSTPMQAAADYLGNGAIEINKYETEIYDIIRRESVFLQRVDRKPANGHPHRYFEQTAIAQATYTDPRNITPTPTGPSRVERAAYIKAITNQTNLSLFDVDVTRQQGQFAYVEAKDIEDILNSIIVASASGVWTGTDTSLVTPTTQQYVSVLTQISTTAQIVSGASIIDGLKAQVAQMAANTTYYGTWNGGCEPVEITVEFRYGVAEVSDAVGKYMLKHGFAAKSKLIIRDPLIA